MDREGGGVGGVGYAPQELGDTEGGAFADHRDVGHHGDQEPPGLADSVDGGDDRRRAVPDGEERENIGAEAAHRRFMVLGTPAQVAAGREHVIGSGDDEGGELGFGVDQVHGPLDPVVHGRGQGIPGVGPVDHTPGERAVLLQSQVACAEVIGFVRCGCHRALSSRRLEVHGSCLPGTKSAYGPVRPRTKMSANAVAICSAERRPSAFSHR